MSSYAQSTNATGAPYTILPSGMEWNKPLKAGDMVLPPRLKRHKRPETPVQQSNAMKRNSVQPPLLLKPDNADVAPPSLKAKGKSTDSLMLLQGLKSMLNMKGDNTDVPKSDMDPSQTAQPSKETTTIKTDLKPELLSVPASDKAGDYVAGREPKAWVSPDKAQEIKLKKSDDGLMDIIFPSDKTAQAPKVKAPPLPVASDLSVKLDEPPFADPILDGTKPAGKAIKIEPPKATELMDPPKPLVDANVTVSEPKDESFFDKIADPLSSIFGSPVDEDERADVADEKDTDKESSECEPSVTQWNRECGDAGYPAHYVGKIVGETRIECPQREVRDVWLSNSCAAPVASSPVTVQKQDEVKLPKKLELKPEELGGEDLKAAPAVSIQPAEDVVVVPAVDPNALVDGSCGASNGMAADREPTSDLCAYGTITAVFGDGPWRWSCKGQNGGMTVSCAAPVTLTAEGQKTTIAQKKVKKPKVEVVVSDGLCGASSGKGLQTKPLTALCETGAPSAVNGSGPWTWACSGLNGGKAAACLAPKVTAGVCGRSHDRGTEFSPKTELCQAGYASAVNGSGPWYWTCSGLHGGEASTCRAPMKTNAVCGSATTIGHRQGPDKELCHVGLASAVSGDGPWSWSCEGANGGASVACQAPTLSDGTCGPAHGSQYTSTPEMGLCEAGRASRVTGHGPWAWSCAGEKGGITESCTASKGSQEEVASVVSCGAATEAIVLSRPEKDLCRVGDAFDVQGDGPWNWTCQDGAGHSVKCLTLEKSKGVCGKAEDDKSDVEPTLGLCEVGSPGAVLAEGKKWAWICEGVLGGKGTNCSAPRVVVKSAEPEPLPTKLTPEVAAQCGASADQSFTQKPSKDLCQYGKAGKVKGKGPWNWSCDNKKVSVTCRADMFVDASCGDVNGSIQKRAPKDNLCHSGVPTALSGDGPWMWSCVGTGGGTSVSCSAIAQSQIHVDGTCGAAANALMTNTPKANLCDTGSASKVYGEGPWTWTCSGANGGIATTCTTMKVVPKAPPPPGPLVNGVCGSSNGVAFIASPRAGFCTSGTTTALSGNGPWNWSCLGENGGMTVSCTAPLMPPAPIVGACGQAHGSASLTKPRGGLCKAGISSSVSGKGPWTWSCSGTNGGGAVSCVAPLAGKGKTARSLPSISTPSVPTAPLPRTSPSGLVTPSLGKGKLPAMDTGLLPQRKSSKYAPKTLPETPVPSAAPTMNVELQPITSVKKNVNLREGLMDPVRDADGNVVKGTMVVLDPETSTIYFERGKDALDEEGVEIAERLSRIMKNNPTVRVTLTAYSDTGGVISPRKARKLSLKRALSIRDFLAVKGIPNTRVDVRPKGANVPSGDVDRVDIKVNK